MSLTGFISHALAHGFSIERSLIDPLPRALPIPQSNSEEDITKSSSPLMGDSWIESTGNLSTGALGPLLRHIHWLIGHEKEGEQETKTEKAGASDV